MRRILYRLKHSWCCVTPRLLCRLLKMLLLFLEAVLHLDDLKISQPVSDHVLPETIVEVEIRRAYQSDYQALEKIDRHSKKSMNLKTNLAVFSPVELS